MFTGLTPQPCPAALGSGERPPLLRSALLGQRWDLHPASGPLPSWPLTSASSRPFLSALELTWPLYPTGKSGFLVLLNPEAICHGALDTAVPQFPLLIPWLPRLTFFK